MAKLPKIHPLPGFYYLGWYERGQPTVLSKNYKTLVNARKQAYSDVEHYGETYFVFKPVGYKENGKYIRTHDYPVGLVKKTKGGYLWITGPYTGKTEKRYTIYKNGKIGKEVF